jgi:predicted DCC family thiol-disulfide oxidoreductase YuxK
LLCLAPARVLLRRAQDRISVHANDGAQFAKSHDMDFAQVSAHKLSEVEPVFTSLAAAFHHQYQETLSTLAAIV